MMTHKNEQQRAYWFKLGLSQRATQYLLNNDITSLEQLRRFDLRHLARTPNLGPVTMVEYFELLTGKKRSTAGEALKRERRKEINHKYYLKRRAQRNGDAAHT